MNKILIAGRSGDDVTQLESSIKELGDYETTTNVVVNGHADPLYGLTELPAVLVLVLEEDSTAELDALLERPLSARVPVVVIGHDLDPATMRLAMQCGARDFLSPDSDEELLKKSLSVLLTESQAHTHAIDSRQIAIINASGGSGATSLAVNLAHSFVIRSEMSVALLDLDLQFAPTGQYFDIKSTRGLLEALERVDELDTTALDGYMSIHASGVELLSALPSAEIQNRSQLDTALGSLSDLLKQKYQRVLVDVPSQLDELGAAALERSDHILIVLQQNIVSIRNAARLCEILRHDLAIPDNRVVLVVNRFEKNSSLELGDIKRTVKSEPIFVLPNSYRALSESIDLGIPMMQQDPKAALSKAIVELEKYLGGKADIKRGGLFSGKLAGLLGA